MDRILHVFNEDLRSQERTFDEARHEPPLQLMPLLVLLLCAKILDKSTKDCFIFECRLDLDKAKLDGEF